MPLHTDAMLRAVLQGLSGIPGEHNYCIYANSTHGSRGIRKEGRYGAVFGDFHRRRVAGFRSQKSGVSTRSEARKLVLWIPACAGMTRGSKLEIRDPGVSARQGDPSAERLSPDG